MDSTPPSLLDRLRAPDDPAAWDRFTRLYAPLLFDWARRLGLQESDAADVVQDVFVVLLRELPRFRYRPGGRFRGWLWTVLANKHRERARRAAARPAEVGGDALRLHDPPAPAEEVGAEEYRRALVVRAGELMRAEFRPATWRACWEYVVRGRPAAEVAAELGTSANAVRLAASRVLRRLRAELDGLLD